MTRLFILVKIVADTPTPVPSPTGGKSTEAWSTTGVPVRGMTGPMRARRIAGPNVCLPSHRRVAPWTTTDLLAEAGWRRARRCRSAHPLFGWRKPVPLRTLPARLAIPARNIGGTR
jgi:hypothetical protein